MTAGGAWWRENGKWCGYIEATSQDISQEVKAWSQMCLPNGQWHQAYFQSCGKIALRTTSQGIGVAIAKPWPQSYRKCGGRTEKACASKEAYKPDSVIPALRRNGPKFTQLIGGSLWKASRNIGLKLNNLKAMLPNTNWVYVNLWPTGNVMKEIKAEINQSLYYYSNISHS